MRDVRVLQLTDILKYILLHTKYCIYYHIVILCDISLLNCVIGLLKKIIYKL